jgi:hypothetical protein
MQQVAEEVGAAETCLECEGAGRLIYTITKDVFPCPRCGGDGKRKGSPLPPDYFGEYVKPAPRVAAEREA